MAETKTIKGGAGGTRTTPSWTVVAIRVSTDGRAAVQQLLRQLPAAVLLVRHRSP